MSRGQKLGQVLLGGIAFGALVAVIKGQDTGVRDALGNTSAPWMLVPFLAGALYSRLWHAALAGVAATLAAFFGFYLAEAAVLDLGPHPWYTDLRLTLGSGQVFETWGLLTGAAYGALGGMWTSRSLVAGPIAVALAFICEPLIVLILRRGDLGWRRAPRSRMVVGHGGAHRPRRHCFRDRKGAGTLANGLEGLGGTGLVAGALWADARPGRRERSY